MKPVILRQVDRIGYKKYVRESSEDFDLSFVVKCLEELADVTWGYTWPACSKNYLVYRIKGKNCWYARNTNKPFHSYRVYLYLSRRRLPRFFSVVHYGGTIYSRDASKAALNDALKVASRNGPVQCRILSSGDDHELARKIGSNYVSRFIHGKAKSYELELNDHPNLRAALNILSTFKEQN